MIKSSYLKSNNKSYLIDQQSNLLETHNKTTRQSVIHQRFQLTMPKKWKPRNTPPGGGRGRRAKRGLQETETAGQTIRPLTQSSRLKCHARQRANPIPDHNHRNLVDP